MKDRHCKMKVATEFSQQAGDKDVRLSQGLIQQS